MKWSTVLLVASIGMRTTVVQVAPSVDVLMTMSLDEQPLRKRQSCQTTKTLPAPSISAEGSGPVRRPPATVCLLTALMVTGVVQVEPPLVERNARIDVSVALAIGTITVPLGCDDRLTADAGGVAAGVLGRAPGQAAVGGGTHLDAVAVAVVVPLGVAVAVERAGRRVVAGDPVLVEVAAGGDGDRVAEGQAAVGRAAGEHGRRVHAAGLRQRQRGDHPDVVPGVVGDRGVADPVERRRRRTW